MLLHQSRSWGATSCGGARHPRRAWGDGRVTGRRAVALTKNNEQLPLGWRGLRKALQPIVLQGLNRHAIFFSAALPKRCSRRCSTAATAARPTRSATMWTMRCASSPARWASACAPTSAARCSWPTRRLRRRRLVIEDTFGAQSVKLPAGDMVLYPGTSVHQVEPVTRGHRVASFFWVEHGAQRQSSATCCTTWTRHLMHLRASAGETDPASSASPALYHNPAARLGRHLKRR